MRFGDVSRSAPKRSEVAGTASKRDTFARLARNLGWALFCVTACTASPTETDPNPWCESVECSSDCATMRWSACDVSLETCRRSVLLSVQCARGVHLREPPHVTISTKTEGSDASAPGNPVTHDVGQQDAGTDAGPSSSVELTQQRADRHYSRAMQLLGMLEDGVAAGAATEQELRGSTASFDSDGVQLELSDEGRWRNMARLAHEYVHAIQRERHPDTTEWRRRLQAQGVSSPAFRALVEGEADLYQRLSLAFMQRQRLEQADVPGQLRAHRADSVRAIARSTSPGASAWIRAPYRAGAELHWALFAQRGRHGTGELLEAFPRDLAAWIRGDRLDTPRRVACTEAYTPLVAATERTSRTEEGAYLLLALLLRTLPAESSDERDERWLEAGRWRGDCLEVFAVAAPGAEQETTQLRWTIAVDDVAFATRLRDALRDVAWPSDLTRVKGSSDTVIISVGH